MKNFCNFSTANGLTNDLSRLKFMFASARKVALRSLPEWLVSHTIYREKLFGL